VVSCRLYACVEKSITSFKQRKNLETVFIRFNNNVFTVAFLKPCLVKFLYSNTDPRNIDSKQVCNKLLKCFAVEKIKISENH